MDDTELPHSPGPPGGWQLLQGIAEIFGEASASHHAVLARTPASKPVPVRAEPQRTA